MLSSYSALFFLMIRRPPRSTQSRSSAASDVYKRQLLVFECENRHLAPGHVGDVFAWLETLGYRGSFISVSYTHLRAHETVLDLVCRLLLETKKQDGLYKHTYGRYGTVHNHTRALLNGSASVVLLDMHKP